MEKQLNDDNLEMSNIFPPGLQLFYIYVLYLRGMHFYQTLCNRKANVLDAKGSRNNLVKAFYFFFSTGGTIVIKMVTL